MNLLEFLSNPWPWYVAGPLIAITMLVLLGLGKRFGVSGSLKTACAATGLGDRIKLFDFNWKKDSWNFVFIAGTVIGGFIASTWLANPDPIALNPKTVSDLEALGFADPGGSYLPAELFSWSSLLTLKGGIMLILGGFLVGFGARWADGCTSGHAISGLSNLQWPSLLTVVGFFIGGLLSTFVLFPLIFS